MPRRLFHVLLVFGLLLPLTRTPLYSAEAPSKDAPPKTEAPTAQEQEEYYELFKVLVDVMDQVEQNYVEDIDRKELMKAAIQGVMSKLDPYSNYIPPEQLSRFKTSIESEFGGVGIQVSVENGRLKVISPLVGSPAYKAGVLAGDVIVKIGDEATKGYTIDDAVRKLKGKPGSEVTFSVVHEGESNEVEITVRREVVHVETVLGDTRDDDDAWDFMLDHKEKIGYVRVNAFSRDTARDLRAAINSLLKEDMQGLIVDLRFNPGGLLTSAIDICDMFISEGRIVSTKDRAGREKVVDATKPGTLKDFPMAILVNRYSASASEIVSACLQDHKRAVVIGERTWGKGSVQNVVTLDGGESALKLTTASYHRPSGKNIHRFPDAKDSDEWGVMPNDGYRLRLSNGDLSSLVRYRRDRDIVLPHATEAPDPEDDDKVGPQPRKHTDKQLVMALEYLDEQIKQQQAKSE